MNPTTHFISDKRKTKIVVYEIKDVNQDIVLQQISSYRVGKSTIRFDAPNSTAIFMSSSDKELKLARSIYNDLIEPKRKIREEFRLSDEELTKLYDYFEHIETSIIMAYTAVECLCNALIPTNYSFTQSGQDDIERTWNKDEIQRWKSTSLKLRQVLPKALNIKDPGHSKHHSTFSKLEELRNEIIHTRSVLPIEIEERNRLYSKLLQDNVFNKVKSAVLIIKELHSYLPTHRDMPILYDTEDIEKIKVDSWDDSHHTRTGNW